MAERRCWWCGRPAEVDTELPESGGMVRDSDTSWLCADGKACSQRAYAAMVEPGYRRNIGHPVSPPQPRRRRRWAVQCYCGRVLLGSTRRSGRGFERYRKHWRDAHGGAR